MRRRAAVRAVAAALTALSLGFPALASAACPPGTVEFRTAAGRPSFHVTYARTAAEQQKGLMGRKHMAADAGMLFLFGKEGPVSFWMHDTLIPLDMIFLDRRGRVVRIHANARPLDDTPIPGGDNVFAVLEVNGGAAAHLGIKPGTALRAAVMPQAQAAWRCDAQ